MVFQSLASVLSDEAGKIFKFKEQEQLHTMVIDTSLEDLYKELLLKGNDVVTGHGIQTTTELLRGKPYSALYERLQRTDIDLLVMGRTGMHQGRYDTIGSNTERIAELSQTNVLVVAGNKIQQQLAQTAVAVKHDIYKTEIVHWDDEAKKRLENIPGFARPMAVLAIERYAKENGITVITPEVMREARGRYEK
jgi:nucleotide-binding universal stress UspA family protein